MKKHLGAIVSLPVAFLTLACSIGCESDSQPLNQAPVVIHLEVWPSVDGVVAEATVRNQSFYPVKYWSGCGCDIGVWVEDEYGSRLRLYCGPEPQCPCIEVDLSPGKTKVERLLFQGLTCVGGELGTMAPVEPGHYEIVASFSYSGPTNAGVSQNIQDHKDFIWPEAKER